MSRRVGDTTMLFKPLAYASTLDRNGAIAAARLRGGVLEPGARLPLKIRRQKQPLYLQRQLPRQSGRGPFSLRRGLDGVSVFFKLSITSSSGCASPSKRRRRPSRV